MAIKAGARLLGGLVLLTAAPVTAQTETQTESTAGQEATPVTREMIRLRGEVDKLREEVEKAHQAEPAVEDGIKLGGAVRFNYGYRDWNQSDKDKLGTAAFDTFRINADGSFNDVLLSAEFRWYRYQSVLHHAWAGYDFTDNLQAQLGVSRVPFGLLPRLPQLLVRPALLHRSGGRLRLRGQAAVQPGQLQPGRRLLQGRGMGHQRHQPALLLRYLQSGCSDW